MSGVAGMQTSPCSGDTDVPPESDTVWAAYLEPHVNELLTKLRETDDPATPYTPYLRAVHSGSRGYAQRVPGSLTTRLHDFLSRHEFHAFLLFDWQRDKFSNIREQFSLPLGLTLAVSRRDKIPHPYFKAGPNPLSVDFMLSLHAGGWLAVDFKEKRALKNPRSRKKLELAAIALAEVGVTHEIMTEEDIPAVLVRNYRFLRTFSLPFDPPPLDPVSLDRVASPLRQLLADGRTTIFSAAIQVSKDSGIDASRLARACYWLVANRHWPVDFQAYIGPDYPLSFTQNL